MTIELRRCFVGLVIIGKAAYVFSEVYCAIESAKGRRMAGSWQSCDDFLLTDPLTVLLIIRRCHQM